MKSLTFIIPVRIDNASRWDNLLISIKYLKRTFLESEILLVEDSSKPDCSSLSDDCSIKYLFIKNDGNFSKSNAINQAIRMATRKYIMIYDLDILVGEDQIRMAVRELEKGKKHIILPHISVLLDVRDPLKTELAENLNLKLVPRYKCLWFNRGKPGYDLICSGSGVAIFRKDLLIKIGGFNCKMKSYGWEDTEILKRAAKLGIYYYSLYWGNIIHLHHERGADSRHNEFYKINEKEYRHVISMKPEELIDYVRNDLAIDDENRFTVEDYRKLQKQNLFHLNYLAFFINRAILKILDLKFV